MSRNALWEHRTFGPFENIGDDIAKWLTELEDTGDVVDVKFENDRTHTRVFARVQCNVSRKRVVHIGQGGMGKEVEIP